MPGNRRYRCWAAAVAALLSWTPLLRAAEHPAGAAKATAAVVAPLVDEGVRAGIDRARLEAMVGRLNRSGCSAEQGRQILYPAFEAARAGLPSDAVLAKVEEGLLKRASPPALAEASRRRLEALRTAKHLLSAANFSPVSPRARPLLVSTALALESGLPEQILASTFRRARGRPRSQVRSVVEGGEALWLARLEPPVVDALMADCVSRNLGHEDVLRVVRFATEKKRQGMAGPAIRESLWKAARPPAPIISSTSRSAPGAAGATAP